MAIIWRGLGWLVAVIVFGMSLIMNLIFNAIYGEGYYDTHKWPLAIALALAGVSCWFVGGFLKKNSDRPVIDKETGEEFVMNRSLHSLFFIPMQLWGPLLGVIALAVLVMEQI